jgi:dethiobiotin synthetase
VNFLVTGTDTGVGKTFVTSALIRTARIHGIDCVGMKPFCTGGNEDVQSLGDASEHLEPEQIINPIWFRTPASPYAASIIENRHIDLESVRNAFRELTTRHPWVLVEGAGGLAVPILAGYDFRDLARDLGLSVIVVAANRLGAINHTRLTVEATESAKLRCEMVILNELTSPNDPAQHTNFGLLEDLLEIPIFSVGQNQSDLSAIFQHLWKRQ